MLELEEPTTVEFLDFEDTEEADEALSLRDLPIQEESQFQGNNTQRENDVNPDQDLFEFYSDLSTEMCAAEDIFFSGKLLPCKPLKEECENGNSRRKSFSHIRSESLGELHSYRRSSTKEKLFRSSYSVDYQKLQRDSSSKNRNSTHGNRNSCGQCFGNSDLRSTTSKPKWQNLLMFGIVKAPAEMEMKDIRNRQRRRNPTTFISAFDSSEKVSVNKDETNKTTWKILRALSCKSHAESAVVASFTGMRPARLRTY